MVQGAAEGLGDVVLESSLDVTGAHGDEEGLEEVALDVVLLACTDWAGLLVEGAMLGMAVVRLPESGQTPRATR